MLSGIAALPKRIGHQADSMGGAGVLPSGNSGAIRNNPVILK